MSRCRRLLTLLRTVLRYRLDALVVREAWPRWLRVILFCLPKPRLSRLTQTRGERLRCALESLGPLFVKFGQLISTRPDLIPEDLAVELEKLQDDVPPFSSEQAIAIVEHALGGTIDTLFRDFEPQPLASASVAQVHTATLPTGEEVVVKVVRPGIEKIIKQDLALLASLARWLERLVPDARRLRLIEVVADYRYIILDELDMQREAASTSQLKRHFQREDQLLVPTVYFDYTSRQVLVMERVDGIPVSDNQALHAHNINIKKLAERGVEIFFTQVFRDNFFHADMHPGNVLVSKSTPQSPRYIAVDCAIMGSLSEADQYYLACNLLAIFHRDYERVAQLHIECGWVPETTSVHAFAAAIRSVCEPIFEKPLGEIAFAKMLLDLFKTARRFDMVVQPSLVLLQKTLFNIEGLGRQLYPALNLWATAKPFLERWLRDRYGPRGLVRQFKKQLPYCWRSLTQLPTMLAHYPQRMNHLVTLSDQQNQQLKQCQRQIKRLRWQLTVLMFVGVLLALVV